MTESPSVLRLLAYPQDTHRERYGTELDQERGRPQRFIRVSKNPDNYEHPTVEVRRSVIHTCL